MPSTTLTFSSLAEHRAWLATQSQLPDGFRVATKRLEFMPEEVAKPSKMTLTLIATDQPTTSFAAMYTRNAFPGAPVIVGRQRLNEPKLGAILINSKIANVCAPNGVETAERLAGDVAALLQIDRREVLPCSTGVIGWSLPADAMSAQLKPLVAELQSKDILPAAEGIVTTDLYPKVRRATVGTGTIVGIAKGAGMIEPNLATMLIYILTDCDVPRETLRSMLAKSVEHSFNCMSIDSDTSTSDTVVALSSRTKPCSDLDRFEQALSQICSDLCEDVVRNGEGVHHVMRVSVRGAPTRNFARGVGKSVVNSPLLQCAICGNDANVGRLVMAIGKQVGAVAPDVDLSRTKISMGGQVIFSDGSFRLNRAVESALVAHLRETELYASVAPSDGLTFKPPIRFPPHEKCVEIAIDLGLGNAECTVLGADRTHEYISENADYRT